MLSSLLFAESVDEALEGFDDTTQKTQTSQGADKTGALLEGFDEDTTELAKEGADKPTADTAEIVDRPPLGIKGLTGAWTTTAAYSYQGSGKHGGITMLKYALFLDYERRFENDWKSSSMLKPTMIPFTICETSPIHRRKKMRFAQK